MVVQSLFILNRHLKQKSSYIQSKVTLVLVYFTLQHLLNESTERLLKEVHFYII